MEGWIVFLETSLPLDTLGPNSAAAFMNHTAFMSWWLASAPYLGIPLATSVLPHIFDELIDWRLRAVYFKIALATSVPPHYASRCWSRLSLRRGTSRTGREQEFCIQRLVEGDTRVNHKGF